MGRADAGVGVGGGGGWATGAVAGSRRRAGGPREVRAAGAQPHPYVPRVWPVKDGRDDAGRGGAGWVAVNIRPLGPGAGRGKQLFALKSS